MRHANTTTSSARRMSANLLSLACNFQCGCVVFVLPSELERWAPVLWDSRVAVPADPDEDSLGSLISGDISARNYSAKPLILATNSNPFTRGYGLVRRTPVALFFVRLDLLFGSFSPSPRVVIPTRVVFHILPPYFLSALYRSLLPPYT